MWPSASSPRPGGESGPGGDRRTSHRRGRRPAGISVRWRRRGSCSKGSWAASAGPRVPRAGGRRPVRLAAAYADLLEIQGENDRAMDWSRLSPPPTPEDVMGAARSISVRSSSASRTRARWNSTRRTSATSDADARSTTRMCRRGRRCRGRTAAAGRRPGRAGDRERLPEDDEGLGTDFDAHVEAEVAELLGEIGPPSDAEPSRQARLARTDR